MILHCMMHLSLALWPARNSFMWDCVDVRPPARTVSDLFLSPAHSSAQCIMASDRPREGGRPNGWMIHC